MILGGGVSIRLRLRTRATPSMMGMRMSESSTSTFRAWRTFNASAPLGAVKTRKPAVPKPGRRYLQQLQFVVHHENAGPVGPHAESPSVG